MKPLVNPKRSRRGNGKKHLGGGGGGGGGGGRPLHQMIDSNGPEGRIRGNAHQILEKYLALARDATSSGDRISAENFYQHAEHYYRIISAANANGQGRPPQRETPQPAEQPMAEAEADGEADSEAPAPEETTAALG